MANSVNNSPTCTIVYVYDRENAVRAVDMYLLKRNTFQEIHINLMLLIVVSAFLVAKVVCIRGASSSRLIPTSGLIFLTW